MIKIAEYKDLEELYKMFNKLNDRTKRQTIQIKELQKKIKQLTQNK